MPRRTPEEARYTARKSPAQSRSKAAVHAIKQATLELAAREGFASLTTGAIAERAGLSKGSLYQYFPAREAIFVALFEDTSAEIGRELKDALRKFIDADFAEAVPAVLRQHLRLVRKHQLVILQMLREIPDLRSRADLISYDIVMRSAGELILRQNLPDAPDREIERKSFLAGVIVRSCIAAFVECSPPGISDRAFISDLSGIVLRYTAE